MSTLKVSTLQNASSATANITLDASGNATVGGTLAMGSSFLRNRIINGAMAIDQRNAGASLSSGGGIVYSVDRWWFGSNGAATTAQRVAGSGSTQYRLQITGAASVTSVSLGQRIEAANSYDLAGSTVTLSFDMANSLLTSASWTLSYANSTDSFGSLASPTITTISSGSVNITSTVTRYSVQITLPAAATTGLQVQFGVGAQTSGTWTIGNVQLEVGSVATPFERRQYGQELMLCQRYYETGQLIIRNNGASGFVYYWATWAVPKRSGPTVAISGTTYSNGGSGGLNAPTTNGTEFFFNASSTAAAFMQTNYSAASEL